MVKENIKAQKNPVCDCCGSKIYPGDTIYIIDRFCYCEECVEVDEFEAGLFTDLY